MPGTDNDITMLERLSWSPAFTLKGPHSQLVNLVSFSPNGELAQCNGGRCYLSQGRTAACLSADWTAVCVWVSALPGRLTPILFIWLSILLAVVSLHSAAVLASLWWSLEVASRSGKAAICSHTVPTDCSQLLQGHHAQQAQPAS